MSQLIELPGGSWVDPEQVSSISIEGSEIRPPYVVVGTRGGIRIEIEVRDVPTARSVSTYEESWEAARWLRDQIASIVNK